MIMTIDELKTYMDAAESDDVLTAKLAAIELMVRGYTNNNFQQTGYRREGDIVGGVICNIEALCPFEVGDTVQISQSKLNNGLYTVKETDETWLAVNEALADEQHVLVTKVAYPADVKMGVVNMLRWQLRNEEGNSGDTSKKDIQSETISRHSVTYRQDDTESDIDEQLGFPKKYVAFLRAYRKARC